MNALFNRLKAIYLALILMICCVLPGCSQGSFIQLLPLQGLHQHKVNCESSNLLMTNLLDTSKKRAYWQPNGALCK